MISDELGKELHDRATRGEGLDELEKEQLTSWYAAQDAAESSTLGLPENYTQNLNVEEQVAVITQRLTIVTQTIEALAQENARLRQEIAALQQLVASEKTLQPA